MYDKISYLHNHYTIWKANDMGKLFGVYGDEEHSL